MDDRIITASYKWTEEEYEASFAMHEALAGVADQGRNLTGTPLFLAALLVPLWIVLGILALREPGFHLNDLLLLLLIVVSLAFVIFRARSGRTTPRPRRVERKGRDETVYYTFGPAGIEIKTDTATSHLSWDRLSTVVRSNHGFLFYRDAGTFHWTPGHAFADGDSDRLEELARPLVSRYVQM